MCQKRSGTGPHRKVRERRFHQHCNRLGTDPPFEVEEMEVEDASPPRNARERTFIIKMEGYLQKWEELQVGISELEHFLLGPGDGRYWCHFTGIKSAGRRRIQQGRAGRYASGQRSGGSSTFFRSSKEGEAQKQRLGTRGEQGARRHLRRWKRQEADSWKSWEESRRSLPLHHHSSAQLSQHKALSPHSVHLCCTG